MKYVAAPFVAFLGFFAFVGSIAFSDALGPQGIPFMYFLLACSVAALVFLRMQKSPEVTIKRTVADTVRTLLFGILLFCIGIGIYLVMLTAFLQQN